jgi:hypothetical protein
MGLLGVLINFMIVVIIQKRVHRKLTGEICHRIRELNGKEIQTPSRNIISIFKCSV